MKNEEIILQKLDKIDVIVTKLDKLETKMDSMETKMDSMETRMDSMETRMDSMETKMDTMHGEMKEFKEETNLNFIKAEGERGYLDKELSKTNSKVSELQEDVSHIKKTLHVIQTKLGAEQDVPKISARLSAVETVVNGHANQIDNLNKKIGLA